MGLSNQFIERPIAQVLADPSLANDSYLLSALIDHLSDRIYFKDLESRFIKINHNMAQMLHLANPGDAIGKTDQDFLPDDDASVRRRDELRIIQSGLALIDKEELEVWPDGSTTWASTSKMPLFDSAGKCIGTFGISCDITRNKEAESAISDARRDAEIFINSVPSILIGLDTRGRIKRWNCAATEVFGISEASTRGKLLGSCGIEWLRQDIDSEVASLSEQTETARWDLPFNKNGEQRLLGITLRWIKPITSDNAELLIVGADITERVRAEKELLWKTASLEAQTNSTGDGILVVDPEGKKLLQNLRLQALFKVPQDVADNNDDESLLEHTLKMVKAPGPYLEKVMYLYEHRDQTSRDEVQLIDGTVLERYSSPVIGQSHKYYGRIWTFRDITERKRTEDGLRLMSMVVEQSPTSVVITNLRGEVTYVNRQFSEGSGYTADEVLGKRPNILKAGYSSPANYRQLWETITAKREWRGLFHNRKKNGELYWESAVIRSIEDEDGAVSHFFALKEDISEKLAMEAQLRQSQKLEAIGHLAAGIAHEINTPIQYVGDNTNFFKDSWGRLAGLLAAAQKLRDEVAPGMVSQKTIDGFDQCISIADVDYLCHDIPRAIEETLEGVRRVAGIVNAMKEFSHPGSQEKRAVDLNRAIETTVTISRSEWKYVAEVSTHLDPNLPLVPCLAGEINQVLLNLVVNAAHAIADLPQSEENGLGTITFSTRTDGDCVEISVTDTGTGISDDIRERVFDPFFTTKEVGKGTGQGLTLAHSVVVKKHGGRIWFDSEVGKGTTFFIRLPISVAVEE